MIPKIFYDIPRNSVAEGEAAHAACVAGSAERMARERAAEDAANDADEAGRAAIDAYHCPPIASDIPVSPIGCTSSPRV